MGDDFDFWKVNFVRFVDMRLYVVILELLKMKL